MNSLLIVAASAFIVLLGLGFVIWILGRQTNKRRFLKQLEIRLFLIRLPVPSGQEADLNEEIGRSERFFSALAAFKEPVIFEVAVPYIGEEVSFYGAVPERFSSAFVKQINAIWPEAEVISAEDYNIFNYAGAVSGV